MKQVDFYLISNQVSDAKLKLASRLTNKLQRLEQRTLIVTNDAPETNELDALMWSFSDTSFVTHETLRSSNEANSSGHCTAQIGDHSLVSTEVLEQDFDVLINVIKFLFSIITLNVSQKLLSRMKMLKLAHGLALNNIKMKALS